MWGPAFHRSYRAPAEGTRVMRHYQWLLPSLQRFSRGCAMEGLPTTGQEGSTCWWAHHPDPALRTAAQGRQDMHPILCLLCRWDGWAPAWPAHVVSTTGSHKPQSSSLLNGETRCKLQGSLFNWLVTLFVTNATLIKSQGRWKEHTPPFRKGGYHSICLLYWRAVLTSTGDCLG